MMQIWLSKHVIDLFLTENIYKLINNTHNGIPLAQTVKHDHGSSWIN